MVGVASMSVEKREHKAADPLFLVQRDDRQVDVALGLRIPLGDWGRSKVSVRPVVSYTSNDSNIALYKYDRVTASVSLRAEF